jgi:hypothetical protein
MREIVKEVNKKLRKSALSCRVLLSRFGVPDPRLKSDSYFNDPSFIPFFFHLGKYIKPVNVLEFEVNLGICSGLFLSRCKTVKHLSCFQQRSPVHYSLDFAKHNIRLYYRHDLDIYYGNHHDEQMIEKIQARKWDLIIVNGKYGYDQNMQIFDMVWDFLTPDASLIVDYIDYDKNVNQAYSDFCKIKNRDRIKFKTRYGVGVITK